MTSSPTNIKLAREALQEAVVGPGTSPLRSALSLALSVLDQHHFCLQTVIGHCNEALSRIQPPDAPSLDARVDALENILDAVTDSLPADPPQTLPQRLSLAEVRVARLSGSLHSIDTCLAELAERIGRLETTFPPLPAPLGGTRAPDLGLPGPGFAPPAGTASDDRDQT